MISVIICSHNPREDYLARTLAGLRAQLMDKAEWELLLVDNASQEPLGASVDLSWHPNARCLREDEIGLTPARLRGIKEAKGDLLLFVDDDNVLVPDYLVETLAIMNAHGFLGVIGAGNLDPEFETQPSREVRGVLSLLALRNVDSARWSSNVMDGPTLPWGAGLCVRREIAQHYVELVKELATAAVLDRRGGQLFCGGDDLFSWAAAERGYGFGIFPQLRINHLISASRVEPAYLLRLTHDHSFSHGVLRYLLAGNQPSSFDVMRRIRIFLHGLRNGSFSMKYHLETARGETEAAQFISDERLRPLKERSRGPSKLVPNEPRVAGAK